MEMETTTIEMEMEMMTAAMETDKQCAAQHTDVIKSNTIPQHGTSSERQQYYSHEHHWPPKQQYKSKNWTIAIILKLTLVAWDSWTYRIGL